MRLLELRKENGLTQTEVAKKLFLSQNGYASYESGRTEPNIETLCKLADYYNVSLDYLVGRNRVGDIGYLTPAQTTLVQVIKKLNQQNLLLLTGRAMAMLEAQGE